MTKILKHMIQHDAAGGVLLMVMALLALIIANSPFNALYHAFLNLPASVTVGGFEINKPLLLWINDGLMAIFFFLVGMEVKRELIDGHLRSVEHVVLPAVGAVAGILVPAGVYVFINANSVETLNGWAIPSATDIAFALGIFSLFGRHLPITLKLFLLSVAIFDDIGAVLIIALFYSADLSTQSLVFAGFGLALLFVLNRLRVNVVSLYILVGIFVWVSVLKSGVHATLAGFLVAWFIPFGVKNKEGHPLLNHLEHAIQPWVAFFVLPLFAFTNAGVNLLDVTLNDLISPLTLGIAAGLFIGKQVGIFGICWLVIKLGWAKLPNEASWLQFYGVSLLCGVGFTMSLFIGSLAFEGVSDAFMSNVKVGVLVGSITSAILGGLVLSRCNYVKPKSTP